MHRYAIDWFLNLFTAEITVLFVANRQRNTLKIICSGAATCRFVYLNFDSFLAKRRAKWVYNLFVREARSQCVNRAWVLASCKLAALIFTLLVYIRWFPQWRHTVVWRYGALLFLGNIRLKAISNSHQWQVLMKSCLLIVCKTVLTIGESQATSHANRTANTRTPNCQSLQGKIWHRKILSSENADLKFNGASNKDGWRRQQQTAEQREHHSVNFKC